MSNEENKKFVNYSPVGTLKFPRLNKADKFKGKEFFKAVVVLDPKDEGVDEFMENLQTYVLENLNEGDFRPVKINDDGMIEITAKRLAQFGKPRFFQPTGENSSEELKKAPGLIWGGTKASISFTSYFYDGGVSFSLIGVCIHELVEPEKKKEDKEEKKLDDKKKSTVKKIFGK